MRGDSVVGDAAPARNKWTPGPWRAHSDVIVADIPDGEYVTTAIAYYGDELRHVGGLPCGETRDANGRMIAAAPEMWAAGMAADTCLSLAWTVFRELGQHDEAKHLAEVQRSLRAALSKARGES